VGHVNIFDVIVITAQDTYGSEIGAKSAYQDTPQADSMGTIGQKTKLFKIPHK